MVQAQLWDARNLQWKILFKRTWLLLILLGRQKFFVHERFEDICDAMKFGVDKKKRVFQRGKSVILVMVRVINWISDIFCVLSFYLIRSWDVGDTFPGALKISAMYLRYVVPTTPGNNVSKCFIWLAVIFRGKYLENVWKFWKKHGLWLTCGSSVTPCELPCPHNKIYRSTRWWDHFIIRCLDT